jgi:hypothetical protein
MWENIVERGRTQMAIWRMRVACWIPKATDTNSEYVILQFQFQFISVRPSQKGVMTHRIFQYYIVICTNGHETHYRVD